MPEAGAEDDIALPSKSEIIRSEETGGAADKRITAATSRATAEIKPPRTFSIKDVITEAKAPAEAKSGNAGRSGADADGDDADSADTDPADAGIPQVELTEDNFAIVWKEFRESFSNEGPRIASMLKSLKFNLEDDHTIRIYFTNASQKDLFNENYRKRILMLLKKRFLENDIDIETVVDVSETRETPYTDEQKYNYLKNKYPAMKDFIRAFNLDFT